MLTIWNWIKNNPNRFMFLIPIILVAIISISHVVTWYDMANPIMWAVYLSVAIEIAAMTALVAASSRITSGIWFMFGLVTFIQIIGNVFYCFKEIDSNGELFIAWVELTSPVWELIGTEITDIVSLKRWLAFLTGGLLPVISLTSLHFFITFDREERENSESSDSYFETRNKKIEKIVMSKPEESEFNTTYPFTEEMKENIKKAEEAKVEENIGTDDYDSEGNLNYTPHVPNPHVEEEVEAESVETTTPITSGDTEEIETYDWIKHEEESQKEKEILEAMKKAEELAIEEEKNKIDFENRKKEEEIVAARKKAEKWAIEEENERRKFEENKRKKERIEFEKKEIEEKKKDKSKQDNIEKKKLNND